MSTFSSEYSDAHGPSSPTDSSLIHSSIPIAYSMSIRKYMIQTKKDEQLRDISTVLVQMGFPFCFYGEGTWREGKDMASDE